MTQRYATMAAHTQCRVSVLFSIGGVGEGRGGKGILRVIGKAIFVMQIQVQDFAISQKIVTLVISQS